MTAPDSTVRCGWVDIGESADATLYRDYHDTEWGVPLHGTQALFERVSLEAFQSGLSWLIILRKRENFRAAFHGFDVAKVAGFGEKDIDRLLADPGIVRNRAKIEATIANARVIDGGLDLGTGGVDPGVHHDLARESLRMERVAVDRGELPARRGDPPTAGRKRGARCTRRSARARRGRRDALRAPRTRRDARAGA